MKGIAERFFRQVNRPRVRPFCPNGLRVYCVGDIHGRVDLLRTLHNAIAQDCADYGGAKNIVYVGDYVDRGDESNAVIEDLVARPLPEFEAIYLRGNHDQCMLDFLQRSEIGQTWIAIGGLATLASYGVRAAKLPASRGDYVALQQELMAKLPPHHLTFLQSTRISYSIGNYYFVHAGIRPDISLSHQMLEDQLWIRDEFLSSRKHFEKIIVHGHSVSVEPEILPNRIGIDTGAYVTGKLTALVLEGETWRLLQTGAS